jgi:3'-phosphoadenosine 5'-phosphosulfate sulfotransferase (PAPS reductase)/FAD synthetase
MTTTATQELQLAEYDVIVLNTSGGKDSSVMVHKMVAMATRQGEAQGLDLKGRMVAVHADLGRVEWEGVRELAARQVARYGLPFLTVSRDEDLLAQIERRGEWPSSSSRFCTSDHKRDQVSKVITALCDDARARTGRQVVRVLNVQGLRAQESPARARKVMVALDARQTGKGTAKVVTTYLPILEYTEDQVWAAIKVNGIEAHQVYAQGMPRLSCTFCVLAGKESLVTAAQLAPAKAQEYLALEDRLRARGVARPSFTAKLSMADIVAEAARRTAAGIVPAAVAEPGCGLEDEHLGAAA